MKTRIFLSTITCACLILTSTLLFTACEKDTLKPDMDTASSGSNVTKPILHSSIPDSALAVLETLAKQKMLDSAANSTTNHANARIGDRAFAGYVSSVYGYPNRLKISGIRIGELCPSYLVRGDREFGGGPQITTSVDLAVKYNQLWAWVAFVAKETKNDYSTAALGRTGSGQWVFIRYIDCSSITQINSSKTSYVNFRGAAAGADVWPGCNEGARENHSPTSGTLVKKFNIIGDTGGNDISNDSDCGCDTKIYSIELNPVTITVAH